MAYDPEIPRRRYDEDGGEKEWARLEKDAKGQLLFHSHMDVLRRHVLPADRVLEAGAGPGRFTKELAAACRELVVADLSVRQLEANRARMEALGLGGRIAGWHVLDILDMGVFPDASFDCVVCIGGVLSYLLERERDGLRELLRVLAPGGRLILGVMGFIGTVLYYMDAVKPEMELLGIDATRWLFETGVQDPVRYPVPNRHYVHMFRAAELDALLEGLDADVVERRAAGLLTLGRDEALEAARSTPELWDLYLAKELEFDRLPGTLDCGINLVYVVRRR